MTRGSADNFEVPTSQSGHPLVSVIIPSYNRAWALQTTIQSLFDQTYRPIECLIIDDGSTDNTADIVKRFVSECPDGIYIRYFKKENGGPNSARNLGLLECKGDFVCYLDSDDMLMSDSIGVRAHVLIENPEVDFCYGLCSIRDEYGKEIGRMNEPWPTSDKARISRYLFHTSSPLIRRTTCARVGLWREDDSHGLEYEYFSRLKYCSNEVYFINKILSVYVRHENKCINDRSQSFYLSVFRNTLTVKALLLHKKHDNMAERYQIAAQFRQIAKQLFRLRDYFNARAALEESLIMQRNVKALMLWFFLTLMAILKKENPR